MADISRNLVQHRRPPTWWARNADTVETLCWVVAGAAGGFGLSRLRTRERTGLLLAAAGGWLLSAPSVGLAARLERLAGVLTDGFRRQDPVAEASEESFPASDPPSWTPTAAGAPHRGRPGA